jgi:hypothetical protein
MNVQTLLDQAAACKTDDDAHNLCFAMQEAFTESGPLSHLPVYNPDFNMEDTGPYVQFELNREITEYYTTAIKPEIRDGKFAIVVRTYHMKDGLGMQSQNYDIAEGLDEEVIDGSPDQTIEELAQRAKELALADHRLLIERVGVPESAARQAAQATWDGC